MKILVFSDSHSYTDFMVECTRRVMPDVLIHLGDYYLDTEVLTQNFPDIPLYAVPGNCDRYRAGFLPESTCVVDLDGVRFLLTHGHLQGVKQDLTRLKLRARHENADAVLFGHTHEKLITQDDGLWLINPGTCGFFNTSAALIITDNKKISHCEHLSW